MKKIPDTPPVKQRKRGGQPRNANALKFGFYSRYFNHFTNRDLEDHQFEGLADEITMLRVYIRQTLELAAKPASLAEALDVLRAISIGFYSLSRLVKTHYLVFGTDDELHSALMEALQRVRVKMGISPPSPDLAD